MEAAELCGVQAELCGVQAELLAHLSDIFEIWLGFTFATLVAFDLVANQLPKPMVRVAQTLYAMALISFIARYFVVTAAVTRISGELEPLGLQPLVPKKLEASSFSR